MRINDLIELIIRPALTGIGMYSTCAEQLMAGTIAHESSCARYVKQQGGPALGITMVEPATHYDIHANYLRFNLELMKKLYTSCGMKWHNIGTIPQEENLIYNLRYAVAIARFKYARVPEKLPLFGDLVAQADYWKKYYNTERGKGKQADYIANYEKYVKPYYTK